MSNPRSSTVLTAATLLVAASAQANVVLMRAGGGETDFGSYKGFLGWGNPQDSALHLAIAAAQPGDIVEIRDNDVWTHINNNGYRINTNNITVRGAAGYNPILRSTSAGTNALFYVNANGFTVQNVTFDNTPALHGLHFMELTNGIFQPSQWLQTVDGLTIADVTMIGARSAMRFGVGARTMTNFTMVDNTLTNLRHGLGAIGVGFGGGTASSRRTTPRCGSGRSRARSRSRTTPSATTTATTRSTATSGRSEASPSWATTSARASAARGPTGTTSR